jgi:hypothetical protein
MLVVYNRTSNIPDTIKCRRGSSRGSQPLAREYTG